MLEWMVRARIQRGTSIVVQPLIRTTTGRPIASTDAERQIHDPGEQVNDRQPRPAATLIRRRIPSHIMLNRSDSIASTRDVYSRTGVVDCSI